MLYDQPHDGYNLRVLGFLNERGIRSSRLNKYYSEANQNEETADKDFNNISVSIAYKILDLIKGSMKKLGQWSIAGNIEDAIRAKEMVDFAETITKMNGDKSIYLVTYKKAVTMFLDNKKWDGKSDVYAMMKSAYLKYLIEMTAIIGEGCAGVLSGKYKKLDDAITTCAAYKSLFEQADILVSTPKITNINQVLLKASLDADGNLWKESLHPTVQKLFSEGDTHVDLLKIGKALLFKAFYTILAPVRYVIYLFFFATYTTNDRLGEIQNILETYYSDYDKADKGGKSPMITPIDKSAKMKKIEENENKFRIEAIDAQNKINKRLEEDRKVVSDVEKDTAANISF